MLDRVISRKLEIEGMMMNVFSGYNLKIGCEMEEKEKFWSRLHEVVESGDWSTHQWACW